MISIVEFLLFSRLAIDVRKNFWAFRLRSFLLGHSLFPLEHEPELLIMLRRLLTDFLNVFLFKKFLPYGNLSVFVILDRGYFVTYEEEIDPKSHYDARSCGGGKFFVTV